MYSTRRFKYRKLDLRYIATSFSDAIYRKLLAAVAINRNVSLAIYRIDAINRTQQNLNIIS